MVSVIKPLIVCGAVLIFFYTIPSTWYDHRHREHDDEHPPVPVEMFIMSKCPDAADCIRDLILPVMANISEKIDLQPTFIGDPDDVNSGVNCMHGPEECIGDMLELCAFKLYEKEPKVWLPFINCMFKDISEIPKATYVKNCALESGIEWEKLDGCVSDIGDEGGGEMLRRSARRTQELGIRTSCTITVVGKTRCVRDGGEWTNCKGGHKVSDLISDINFLYDDEDWEKNKNKILLK